MSPYTSHAVLDAVTFLMAHHNNYRGRRMNRAGHRLILRMIGHLWRQA